jgi:hypothetical protein
MEYVEAEWLEVGIIGRLIEMKFQNTKFLESAIILLL